MGFTALGDLLGIVIAGFVTTMAVPHARYWCNRQEGYKMFFAVISTGFVAVLLARVYGTAAAEALSSLGASPPVAPDQVTFDLAWVAIVDTEPPRWPPRSSSPRSTATS